MIAAYLICLLIGIGLFFALARFPVSIRWITAIFTTIVLAAIVTAFVARLGDRPVGEARTISKEDLH